MKKIVRITTSAGSLRSLLKGQLGFMNTYYEIIGIANGEKALSQVREKEGIKTINLNMTRTISPIKDLVAVYKLYKILKKVNPFLVHTHTPKAGIVGMLAAKLAGIKHRLHTVAGMPLLEAKGFKRTILNAVEKLTYKQATLVLPNSFGLQDIILENKFTKNEKLKVVGNGSSNGIDTEQFNPSLFLEKEKNSLKQSLDIKNNDVIFIFIGRLVKDKGINELVKAFSKLLDTYLNCKLLLIGPYENHLDPLQKETITQIEATKNIINLGKQTDVKPFLAIADVLTFPSYREGFPNVVLEASSMSLPCIVTDINGCNEIIQHKKNGLIIPVKSEKHLFEAMLFMVNNPDKRQTMAENSRQNIVDNYQRPYIWNELLKLYKSLE